MIFTTITERGEVNRRDFLKKLTLYAGSVAAAAALLSFTNEHNAPLGEADSIPGAEGRKDKSGVVTEFITYPGETGEMKAFLARPAKKKKYPAVIVIHENRGLQPTHPGCCAAVGQGRISDHCTGCPFTPGRHSR